MAFCCMLGSPSAQERMREIYTPAVIKEMYPPPSAAYVDSNLYENGHKRLLDVFAAHKSQWQAMNSKRTLPEKGTSFPVAFIADQDEASRDFIFRAISSGADAKKWKSMFWYGKLVYDGNKGPASYFLEKHGEASVETSRGDSSKRGAEYSALEVFDGKLLTFCDRTGNCDELLLTQDEYSGKTLVQSVPLINSEGNHVCIPMGDGQKVKPLKVEWATQINGKLLIGSTGKERTDDDGKIVHEGEMWTKILEPKTFLLTHVDSRPHYAALRDAAICPQGAGYMIHESGRWSEVHNRFFFLPRKMSREPYDEVIDRSKCVNLMFAVPAPSGKDPKDHAKDIYMQDYLGCTAGVRGCSDFLFVPGTNDCHLFLLRTEETIDDVLNSYGSVVDLQGNVLMKETLVGKNRKFEGAAWLSGFAHFPGEVHQPPSVPRGCCRSNPAAGDDAAGPCVIS